jgi:AIPR protein
LPRTVLNNNIKETARRLPRRFWAYNNGITALVTEFSVNPSGSGEQKLLIRGLSVVNGAQTTGALGSLEVPDDAQVLARFVMCSDPEVIEDVIQYNNSQNEVEPADRRSMDQVQKRLREEFQVIPEADYRGGRRGSEKDIIARPPNLLPSSTVAQAVAAFHGGTEPGLQREAANLDFR